MKTISLATLMFAGSAYRIRVRFENGIYQTVSQADLGRLRVGDNVRIEDGRAFPY
jgi:outer membrane lipoprotein SlyB